MERRLPQRIIDMLNNITLSHPSDGNSQNKWKSLLWQMLRNTLVYSVLSAAAIMVMFAFALPFFRRLLPGWEMHWVANGITGILTVLAISPFLRAIVMKKNRSDEFKALWAESRMNHLPLIFTIVVRVVIACAFIFYIVNYLSRFTNALMVSIALALILAMILSRSLKHSSIRMERLFVKNLRSRDIEAQVRGKRRPLYEGHLLDRDVHMADFDVPFGSRWSGHTLRHLSLGRKYGVHVSSILRANRRLNIPGGDYMIFPGDRIQVIGSDEQLSKFGIALKEEVYGDDPDLEKREMKLRQIVLTGNSPFVGKTLQESGIRNRYSCMVVGIEEGKENLSQPAPHRKFSKGDIIWVVGEEESLEALVNAR
jgi:CPA2 family monovalent cation:H+ antiporter-2